MQEIPFVKYCPLCGAENPPRQAFCIKCVDGDLSTVPIEPRRDTQTDVPAAEELPSPSIAPAATAYCILASIDDPMLRFIVREGQTVGRTERADVVLAGVPKFEWISGIHAKFTRRGTQWYVRHVGQTNFIKVDGEKYDGREEVALHDGSILMLSLTAFRVSFGA